MLTNKKYGTRGTDEKRLGTAASEYKNSLAYIKNMQNC